MIRIEILSCDLCSTNTPLRITSSAAVIERKDVMFTQQQLQDAYAQMVQERQDDERFAQLAADKLGKLTGLQFATEVDSRFSQGITPHTTDHVLVVSISQCDDMQHTIGTLVQAGVVMQAWNGQSSPEGEWDVSFDASFNGRAKLKYKVRIHEYNSHWAGY